MLQQVYVKQDVLLTVASILAPGCKVEGLPHSQLWSVVVILIDIAACPSNHKFVQPEAIVRDVTRHLEINRSTLKIFEHGTAPEAPRMTG